MLSYFFPKKCGIIKNTNYNEDFYKNIMIKYKYIQIDPDYFAYIPHIYKEDFLLEEYFQNNGIIEGKFKTYNNKGDIILRCNFINNKINGEVFYSSDKCRFVSRYINGMKEGKTKWFYDDRKVMECEFINDKLNGDHIVYYPYLNRIYKTSIYKDNKLNGFKRTYYNNGDLDYECNYINGKKEGKSIRMYNNGKINDLCFYKNNELDGILKEYNYDGSLIREYNYRNGKLNGICKDYYDNKIHKVYYYNGYDTYYMYFINTYIVNPTRIFFMICSIIIVLCKIYFYLFYKN